MVMMMKAPPPELGLFKGGEVGDFGGGEFKSG